MKNEQKEWHTATKPLYSATKNCQIFCALLSCTAHAATNNKHTLRMRQQIVIVHCSCGNNLLPYAHCAVYAYYFLLALKTKLSTAALDGTGVFLYFDTSPPPNPSPHLPLPPPNAHPSPSLTQSLAWGACHPSPGPQSLHHRTSLLCGGRGRPSP